MPSSVLEVGDLVVATSGRRGLECFDSHELRLPSKNSIVSPSLSGHDRLLPVLGLGVTAAHARMRPRTIIVLTSVDLDVEELLDGVADLDLVRATIDLEEELVLRLAQNVALLGEDQRALDDVFDAAWQSLRRSPMQRFERRRRVLGEHEVVVPEEVVDVDALGRQELVLLHVAHRQAQVLVAVGVDDAARSCRP